MKKDLKVYKYKNYVIRMIVLCILPWLITAVYLLTMEDGEKFNWLSIIFPMILTVVFALALYMSRRIFLGKLITFDIDWHTVYELDKRGRGDNAYNLNLLMNLYMVEGEFNNVLSCADKLLQISSKTSYIYLATHQKILALFFIGDFDNIENLIVKQRHTTEIHKKYATSDALYYEFVEKFLMGEYHSAIKTISTVLEDKNISVLNNRKVLVYYLMKMAYVKLGDFEQAQYCTEEILQADINHKTFFSRVQ